MAPDTVVFYGLHHIIVRHAHAFFPSHILQIRDTTDDKSDNDDCDKSRAFFHMDLFKCIDANSLNSMEQPGFSESAIVVPFTLILNQDVLL